jgi:hypothetical protein
MRKDGLSIQVVCPCAALDGVQIVLSAHEKSAVVISQHHSTGAADYHRSIVIANDRAPMMDDADRDPFDGHHGKVGG